MLGLRASLENWDFFSRVLGSHGRAVRRGGEAQLGGAERLLGDSLGNGLRGEAGGQKVREETRVRVHYGEDQASVGAGVVGTKKRESGQEAWGC